jgi:hypothetical protein
MYVVTTGWPMQKTVAMGTDEGILDNAKLGDSGQIWNSRTALSFLVSRIFL